VRFVIPGGGFEQRSSCILKNREVGNRERKREAGGREKRPERRGVRELACWAVLVLLVFHSSFGSSSILVWSTSTIQIDYVSEYFDPNVAHV
jgi:hypothetical protein